MPPFDWSQGTPATPDEFYQDQEELLRKQKQEEEERKRREEQQKLQQKQQEDAVKQNKPLEKYGPPGPDTVQQDRGPVGNFIEDRLVDLTDFVDNTFQGDQKSRDEIRGERDRAAVGQKLKQDSLQQSANGEIIRGILGGVEDFAENAFEKVLENNIFSGGYNAFNFGKAFLGDGEFKPLDVDLEFGIIPENTTEGGEALRTISRYMSSAFGVGALTGGALTAGRKGIGLVAGRALEGGIESLVASDAEKDQTLIGSTPWTQALQVADENDPALNTALLALDESIANVLGGAGVDLIGRLIRHTKLFKTAKPALKKTVDEIIPPTTDIEVTPVPRINELIEQAAKDGKPEEVLNALRTRRDGLVAAKAMDDLYDYTNYGGKPTEQVADVLELDQAFTELDKIDQQLSDIDEFIGIQEQTQQELLGISQRARGDMDATLRFQDQVAAEGATIPEQAPISLNLSKGQVKLLESVGLPEGVTITPGRRVQGLTTENIGEVASRLEALEIDSPSKPLLLERLQRAGSEASQANVDATGAVSSQLQALRDQFANKGMEADIATRAFERRQKVIDQARNWRDTVRIQREALEARTLGRDNEFLGKYVPVDLSTKNVTSIRKETPGKRFQPGIDLYFEDKRFPALLEGRVKDIGNNPGGYGNYVVVESVDPRTGKQVDVLYSHLADNTIVVKEGSEVKVGQQIATQGGTGRVVSQDGTIASVDFLAPAPKGSKSMTPYSGWSELADDVINRIKTGTMKVADAPGTSGAQKADIDAGVRATPLDSPSPTKADNAPQFSKPAQKGADPDFPFAKVAKEAFDVSRDMVRTGTREAAQKAGIDITRQAPLSNGSRLGKGFPTPGEVISVSRDVRDYDELVEQYGKIDRTPKYTFSDSLEASQVGEEMFRDWMGYSPSDQIQSLAQMGVKVDGNLLLKSEENFATLRMMQTLIQNASDQAKQADLLEKNGLPEAGAALNQTIDSLRGVLNVRTQHKMTASGKLREIGDSYLLAPKSKKAGIELQKQAQTLADQAKKDRILNRQLNELKAGLLKGDKSSIGKAKRLIKQLSIAENTPQNFNRIQTLLSANIKNAEMAFIQSSLSGPKTQSRNFWGNFYQSVGHPSLAILGSALPGKANAQRRHQAVAALGATYDTFRELTELFPRLWNKSAEHLDPNSKVFAGYDQKLAERMDFIRTQAENGDLPWHLRPLYSVAIVGHNFVNSPFMSSVFRFMGSVDNFFEIIAGRQIAARRAVEEAYAQLGDAPLTAKRSKEFGELVTTLKEKHMGDIFNESMEIIDDEALQLARGFTFKADPQHLDVLTKSLKFLSDIPGMKILGIPFVQTPAAILKSSLYLTPGLSTLLKNMDAAYRNGDDFTRAMMNGREAMSYMLGVTAFMGGAAGVITGAGPAAGSDRRTWLTSHKPFSITLPDGWRLHYEGLEPAATIIGFMADAGAIISGDRQRDGALALGGAAMSNIVNKSYLTQIATISRVLTSSGDDNRGLAEVARNLTVLVPFAGLRSQVGQILDPNIRELRSTLEPFWPWAIKKQGGLGLSTLAPSQVDPLTGEPLTRDGFEGKMGTNVAYLNALAVGGLGISKNRFKPVHKKLYEAGVDINKISREVLGTELTNEEIVEFQKLRAGDGALERDLKQYLFGKNSTFNIDMEESLRQFHEGGVDWVKTPVYKNTSSIVRSHAQRARAIMDLGLTPVSEGFARRAEEQRRKLATYDLEHFGRTQEAPTLESFGK